MEPDTVALPHRPHSPTQEAAHEPIEDPSGEIGKTTKDSIADTRDKPIELSPVLTIVPAAQTPSQISNPSQTLTPTPNLEPTLNLEADTQVAPVDDVIARLIPNDINFPKLQSPYGRSPNPRSTPTKNNPTGKPQNNSPPAASTSNNPPATPSAADQPSNLPATSQFSPPPVAEQTSPLAAPPMLSSPASQRSPTTPQVKTPQTMEKTPTPVFVWRSKPPNDDSPRTQETTTDKGKAKAKPNIPKAPDSTPITRQGYRTGRLAEDFWTALDIPNIPPSPRKTLQVIPFPRGVH